MTLTRRGTLKLGISAFLSGFSGAASAQDLAVTKVIVVRAGIAGLVAGKWLQSQGAEVVILEAGNYIGGRMRTDRSIGAPFEFGVGWIHGPRHKNSIQKPTKRVNARTFVTDNDSLEVFDHRGEPVSDAAWDRLDEMYTRLERKFTRGVARADKRSIHEVVADVEPEMLNDLLALWMLSAFTEFDIGAGIADIPASNAFSDAAVASKDVVFPDG